MYENKHVEVGLIDHLTELRKRIIIVFSVLVVSLIIGFTLAPIVLSWLKAQPSAVAIDWNVFGFSDGFMIYFKCAILVAMLLTLPVLLYQVWAFIRPGLTESESKGTLFYVPLSFLLFLIGISFSYFIVFPMVIHFMSEINASIGVVETYGLSQYFTFMFNIILPISVVFEMPVVILFLTKLRLVDPQKLRKIRKIAYFILVVIGVSLTPPDIVSDILIIIPLILLFELSILCSSWTLRRSEKKAAK